jgi:ubiquinone/menaquinone biosynthesis C-methylase UbiE
MASELESKAKISGDPFSRCGDGVPYYEMAETSILRQWEYYIWPRIKNLDRTTVVEIGAGYGRITRLLSKISGSIIATDINQECLDEIKFRLSGVNNLSLLKVSGADLRDIPTSSTTFVFSFDSMVHFEPEVVESYVRDIYRILMPGGSAFIHHSNWTAGKGLDFKTQPHWRNYCSKELMAQFIRSAGMIIISQEIFDWDESYKDPAARANLLKGSDCISIFRKPYTTENSM